jgi:peptidylprolyl isomerase
MSTVKNGDTVQVHYTGTLDDGTVFDSSKVEGREPIQFQIGAGQLIPGFENGVLGMSVGDSKKIVIESEDAYGEYVEELCFTVPLGNLPEGVQEGTTLQVMTPNGPALAKVVEINETEAKVDHNHMLAGERLTFDIEVVNIEETVEA